MKFKNQSFVKVAVSPLLRIFGIYSNRYNFHDALSIYKLYLPLTGKKGCSLAGVLKRFYQKWSY